MTITVYAGPKYKQTVITPVEEFQELALANQTAGQAMSGWNAVYALGSGNGWLLADASAPATAPRNIGLVKGAGYASGAANMPVWVMGIISNGSFNFTSGSRVFLASGTGSLVTTTAPAQSGAVVFPLGQARATTVLDLRPGEPTQITQ